LWSERGGVLFRRLHRRRTIAADTKSAHETTLASAWLPSHIRGVETGPLIDAIVRQTTVLVAQLATSGSFVMTITPLD
jgi:hypothetical protein